MSPQLPLKPLLAVSATLLAATAILTTGGGASAADQAPTERANVSDFLADQLAGLAGRTSVMVHGTSITAARQAVAATGMATQGEFRKIGVVVANATKSQIEAVRTQPGVTYVEGGAQPIDFLQETSNIATRGAEAAATITGADGTPLTGKGVSVAVIDSGVDPTHPYLTEADGSSAVAANLKALCEPLTETCSVQRLPSSVDTDTLSVGGHGTHVNGIVAGRPTTLSDGGKVQGAAPGAKLVSISTGAGIVILGADSALNWVLENHAAPCGAGVPVSTCPPIKVTNNSYGPTGGGAFDPESATVKIQRALAAEGVVTVWAAGNDGGDGSASLTNPPGQDPTGGILSVASYNDQDTGTRDGTVSEFSSRGLAGDASTWPDVSAPGENITSSCRPYLVICSTGLDFRNGPGPLDIGTFNTISGTSMAAPHVAGIVAQLFQADPTATPAEIEQALKVSAHKFTDGAPYQAGPLGTTSYDKGYGLVDVVAAVAALG
ncbi:peptidase S8 [Nocardioides sp. Root122]|uniref:S8 family serine peptidase n=1 Tax=Nocardioides TaxID=1839 RepID=UPI0007029B36|nr:MULTISPECIES: S8 family serine peptidase [Nocardioides]KQV67858.1 peptidase S8 [Nocardioides sp. Root122]MCK9823796.1 S8 family serine peptidase [Nocardioides cavernae]